MKVMSRHHVAEGVAAPCFCCSKKGQLGRYGGAPCCDECYFSGAADGLARSEWGEFICKMRGELAREIGYYRLECVNAESGEEYISWALSIPEGEGDSPPRNPHPPDFPSSEIAMRFAESRLGPPMGERWVNYAGEIAKMTGGDVGRILRLGAEERFEALMKSLRRWNP